MGKMKDIEDLRVQDDWDLSPSDFLGEEDAYRVECEYAGDVSGVKRSAKKKFGENAFTIFLDANYSIAWIVAGKFKEIKARYLSAIRNQMTEIVRDEFPGAMEAVRVRGASYTWDDFLKKHDLVMSDDGQLCAISKKPGDDLTWKPELHAWVEDGDFVIFPR